MNMKGNKQVFLNQNRLLPTLYYYMVFVQTNRPILFACRDDALNVYLCSCHCSSGEKTEWIIVPTTYDTLAWLLTDKITIRDAFTEDNSECFLATMRANRSSVTVVQRQLRTVEAIMPTAGYYMEAEPGEFDEELEQLRTEAVRHRGLIQISVIAHTRSFPVDVSAPESAVIDWPGGYLTISLLVKENVRVSILRGD